MLTYTTTKNKTAHTYTRSRTPGQKNQLTQPTLKTAGGLYTLHHLLHFQALCNSALSAVVGLFYKAVRHVSHHVQMY